MRGPTIKQLATFAYSPLENTFKVKNLIHLPPGPAEPCLCPLSSHYIFDMAQQVHYPCNPLQPGPMYFLTPRKCGVFGVCKEVLPQPIFLAMKHVIQGRVQKHCFKATLLL